jgi:hypothetical protein
MNIQTTSTDTETATFQTAALQNMPTAINSCGSYVGTRLIATKLQTESITVRVTTRPSKLNETTT